MSMNFSIKIRTKMGLGKWGQWRIYFLTSQATVLTFFVKIPLAQRQTCIWYGVLKVKVGICLKNSQSKSNWYIKQTSKGALWVLFVWSNFLTDATISYKSLAQPHSFHVPILYTLSPLLLLCSFLALNSKNGSNIGVYVNGVGHGHG